MNLLLAKDKRSTICSHWQIVTTLSLHEILMTFCIFILCWQTLFNFFIFSSLLMLYYFVLYCFYQCQGSRHLWDPLMPFFVYKNKFFFYSILLYYSVTYWKQSESLINFSEKYFIDYKSNLRTTFPMRSTKLCWIF